MEVGNSLHNLIVTIPDDDFFAEWVVERGAPSGGGCLRHHLRAAVGLAHRPKVPPEEERPQAHARSGQLHFKHLFLVTSTFHTLTVNPIVCLGSESVKRTSSSRALK